MSWTAPRTWTTGELVTASMMNTHVRDNLLATEAATVTTAGDLAYATGANALARLGVGSSGAVLNVVSGAPSWASIPSVRAHRTTTLSIATSMTVISFDSESGDWDTSAMHDTGSNTNRFVAPVAGVYAFYCSASISYGAGNTNLVLAARDASANSLARANGVPNATNSVAECTVAGQVKLAAAGWIEFAAAVNGSGTGTLQADAAATPCKAGMTLVSLG